MSPAHAHYDKYESTMVIRFSVWFCGPAVLEQSVLARIIRREQDGSEVTLFEGHTQPGLPSGWQEFLGPVTIPYTDGDCIQVEVDPDEEIQQCVDRCNLWDLACP